MASRRLRFVLSQIGARPSAHLPDPGKVLIGLADLPPGWKIIDQRRWRSGQQPDQGWSARARALGSVTSWRSFASPTKDRALWAQATPLASVDDAQDALQRIWDHGLANLDARIPMIDIEDGPPLAIPPLSGC